MTATKIVPHLWYDKQAKEAAHFYASLFPDSKVTNVTTLHGTPSGDSDVVSFQLAGQPFIAISAGPHFRFNPSVSFHVQCSAKEEVDALWKPLSKGGAVLMELGSYPFSERYGWLQDRYGLSWQLIFVGDRPVRHKITPVLMFVGRVCGRAEEAAKFYASVFRDAKAEILARYGKGEAPDREGTVRYASLDIGGQQFGLMDSAHSHPFAFNEAISFMVNCDTQEQIDYYWARLSAVPQAEQCGWLKDQYGLSWQIIPSAMDAMMRNGTDEQIAAVTQAFLPMKKFDLAALRRAYEHAGAARPTNPRESMWNNPARADAGVFMAAHAFSPRRHAALARSAPNEVKASNPNPNYPQGLRRTHASRRKGALPFHAYGRQARAQDHDRRDSLRCQGPDFEGP